ncbi:MAG: aminotransferase class I/II-fold pyridoxal phosphate-dependent enzyme [Myxococcales bacterium]|nr:aminotransferase class I/II-fold pyridoxal phosphate-dependent enzyme [Myxococcales bacterium]
MPGLRERTVTIQGFSKGLSITGWRQAFAAGPSHMIEAVHCIHQTLYLCPATPLQHGVLRALDGASERQAAPRQEFQDRRDQLAEALVNAGFWSSRPRAASSCSPTPAT